MFSHGLRVSEACGLKVSQVDVESRVLHVTRLKNRLSTTHPLQTEEIKAVRARLTQRAKMKPDTDAFFISERHGPLSRKTAWLAIRRYGDLAGLPIAAHPHMLLHGCGFALADQGADTRLIQDYLWASKHSAHGAVHGCESGQVRKVVEVTRRARTPKESTATAAICCSFRPCLGGAIHNDLRRIIFKY